MYTFPQWRGKGIASTLMKEAINHIKALGGRRIWLDATADGKNIYESFGFIPINTTIGSHHDLGMELTW
jgi:ribosomal protein S18 acetylase RimI-like enzyme